MARHEIEFVRETKHAFVFKNRFNEEITYQKVRDYIKFNRFHPKYEDYFLERIGEGWMVFRNSENVWLLNQNEKNEVVFKALKDSTECIPCENALVIGLVEKYITIATAFLTVSIISSMNMKLWQQTMIGLLQKIWMNKENSCQVGVII